MSLCKVCAALVTGCRTVLAMGRRSSIVGALDRLSELAWLLLHNGGGRLGVKA